MEKICDAPDTFDIADIPYIWDKNNKYHSNFSDTHWITTKTLLRQPLKYSNRILLLGVDYTLVAEQNKAIEPVTLAFYLFADIRVLNSAQVDDIIYVMISVADESHFNDINDKFRTAGMLQYTPRMNDEGLVSLTTYHITAVIQNSSYWLFCIHSIPN